jgi:hypothetical protein
MTKILAPHQTRVLNERADLAEKIERLDSFLKCETFQTIGLNDQLLLKEQRYHMREYLSILDRRIALF